MGLFPPTRAAMVPHWLVSPSLGDGSTHRSSSLDGGESSINSHSSMAGRPAKIRNLSEPGGIKLYVRIGGRGEMGEGNRNGRTRASWEKEREDEREESD